MTRDIRIGKNWAAVLLAAAVIAAPSAARADVVTDWNATALRVHAATGQVGIPRTRVLAMVHAAVHDAINAIDRRSDPYAFDLRVSATASPEAAAASAAYQVLIALLPSQQPALDAAYAAS